MRLASKLAAALAVFFCCLSGFGQAAPISGQAIDQTGAPLPFAQVRVCSATSSGTPCTPTAQIYLDYNLTIPTANPTVADQYGNYTVYAPALPAPNLYVIQLVPGSGITWTYVENGPYCSLSGCTFTGPITAPYYNATEFPYYEVNGVQLASTNLLDTANIAYLNKANVFTGSPQTAPIFNATTGFQFNGAAPSNHILLGNGGDYMDPATLPGSVCPECVLLDPTASQEIVQPGATNFGVSSTSGNIQFATTSGGFSVAVGHGISLADSSNIGISLATVGNISNASVDFDVTASGGVNIAAGTTMDLASVGEMDIAASLVAIGAPVTAPSFTGALTGILGATTPNTIVGTSIDGTSMTDSGLTPGNCVQAGTGGILTTIADPCPIIPATQKTQINIVPGCAFANDGANLTCTNTVNLSGPMADTTYVVSCVEYTDGLSTVVLGNIQTPVIVSATQYTFVERTQGSSSEWGANPNYGKYYYCTAYHS